MNASKSLKMIGISMLLVAGLAACDKPGPAETAGKKLDDTATETGQKINESTDKMAEKIAEEGDKAGIAMDDAEITTRVKAAIFAEPGLRSLQISVATSKGEVTLSGSVDSLPNSNMAKALASAVSGVKKVKNLLAIKPVK